MTESEKRTHKAALKEQALKHLADMGQMADQLAKARVERDRFRAVLEALEYRDIGGIGKSTIEHCGALGEMAKAKTLAIISERDRLYVAIKNMHPGFCVEEAVRLFGTPLKETP